MPTTPTLDRDALVARLVARQFADRPNREVRAYRAEHAAIARRSLAKARATSDPRFAAELKANAANALRHVAAARDLLASRGA